MHKRTISLYSRHKRPKPTLNTLSSHQNCTFELIVLVPLSLKQLRKRGSRKVNYRTTVEKFRLLSVVFIINMKIWCGIVLLLCAKVAGKVKEVKENFCQLSNALQSSRGVILFDRARAELGLPKLNITSKMHDAYANGQSPMNLWYSFAGLKPTERDELHYEEAWFNSDNGFSVANVSGRVVAYKRIWKCANNQFRAWMLETADKCDEPRLRPEGANKGVVKLFNKNVHMDMRQATFQIFHGLFKKAHPKVKLRVIAWVREPMSHFMSGMREWLFRVDKAKRTSSNPYFSQKDVEEVLVELVNSSMSYIYIDGTPFGISAAVHLTPISSRFNAHSTLDLSIGQLEHFADDLKTLVGDIPTLYKAGTSELNTAEHITSGDPNNVEKHLHTIFRENMAMQRAFCWLLLPEYICFDYALPEACVGIDIPREFLNSATHTQSGETVELGLGAK